MCTNIESSPVNISATKYPRIAVVTGAAGGIGRALVEILLQRGYHVEALVRTAQGLDTSQGSGRHAVAVRYTIVDLNCGASVTCVANDLARTHARIDLLINNAAVCPRDGWEVGAFDQAFRVNVEAAARLLSALAPALCAAAAASCATATLAKSDSDAGHGETTASPATVVNVSSGDGELVFFGEDVQCALKRISRDPNSSLSAGTSTSVCHGTDGRPLSMTGCTSALREVMRQVAERSGAGERDGVIHGEEAAYRLSKACLNVVTRRAAAALGPYKVRVVAACPGDVPTRMMSASIAAAAASLGSAATTRTTRTTTEGRIITPARVAARDLIDLAERADTVTGSFYRYGCSIPW